jgi:hypothetical protein
VFCDLSGDKVKHHVGSLAIESSHWECQGILLLGYYFFAMSDLGC